MAEEKELGEAGVEMSFLDHLEELRWRLIRSILAIVIGGVVALFFSDEIMAFLLYPFHQAISMHAALTQNPDLLKATKLIYLAPTEGFLVHIKVALFAGLFVSLPYVFYQLWKFVVPGLLEKERRVIPKVLFFSVFFFFLGSTFCYTIVLRFGLNFLLGYQSPDLVANISIKEYLSFVTLLLLTFGIVFEMPVLAYFLTRLGIVTPEFMRQKRRYSIVVIFIMAAIITPPDAFTQITLAVPLMLLYELSIWVSKIALGKQKAATAK